jgi:type IV secretory pathway TraG/TraD family ATPase VirD4
MNRDPIRPNRRSDPGQDRRWLWGAAAGAAAFAVVLSVWFAGLAAGVAAGTNPVAYALGLVVGDSRWSTGASVVLALEFLLVGGLGAAALRQVMHRRRRKTRVDGLAASLATRRDLRPVTGPGLAEVSRRLRTEGISKGVTIGNAVSTREALASNHEWVQLWLMGPRAGKTSCACVPQLIEHNGPALATSNKRDIVDLSRGPRGDHGRVWVYDVQDIVGEFPQGAGPPAWWWNPLSYVKGVPQADQLVDLFAAASRDAGARSDAYFDGAARAFLSSLLLAAALDDRPITQVYSWLTNPDDDEPVKVLLRHEQTVGAEDVRGVLTLTPKQRDGVVGTARALMSWLRNPDLLPWITQQGPNDRRPQFSPTSFVDSKDTIYLISKEGRGTARALTAALTVAIVDAAEARAGGGRLPVPLLCVLDEAANVCRWPDLPDKYSHFGSKGILLTTYLQSWPQGVEAWGREGMQKLFGAANVRVVGSGLADYEFLRGVSELVGDHDVISRDVSRGRDSRSTSTRVRRERVLEVSDLSGLPPGRAVLLASGIPASLVELVHWSERPYAADVRDSETVYSAPANDRRPLS